VAIWRSITAESCPGVDPPDRHVRNDGTEMVFGLANLIWPSAGPPRRNTSPQLADLRPRALPLNLRHRRSCLRSEWRRARRKSPLPTKDEPLPSFLMHLPRSVIQGEPPQAFREGHTNPAPSWWLRSTGTVTPSSGSQILRRKPHAGHLQDLPQVPTSAFAAILRLNDRLTVEILLCVSGNSSEETAHTGELDAQLVGDRARIPVGGRAAVRMCLNQPRDRQRRAHGTY
jgi:hypothetical protein